MRYSKTNLTKIEMILKSQGYSIRYEKGNFNSGFCLLNDRNIIVINKFYDLKQRMESFFQIAQLIGKINLAGLSEDHQNIWNSVINRSEQLKLVA